MIQNTSMMLSEVLNKEGKIKMGRIFEKFCPECLEVTTCSIETQEKTFRIRGEKVTIQAEYVRCGKCNNLIPDLDRDER
ncbi:MAG: MJ0042-type zinc finger domain-containing protein, partial [Bacillota bacterium]